MRRAYIPAAAFIVLAALFLAFVLSSASNLPATVATHFGGSGQPNAWMTASNYVTFIMAFGLGLPIFIATLFYVIRWLPPSMINLPRRDFWLAPERLRETHRSLFSRGLWLGCLVLLLMLALHSTLLRANQLTPPTLAPKTAIPLLAVFLAGIAVWIITFVWHFLRSGSPASDA